MKISIRNLVYLTTGVKLHKEENNGPNGRMLEHLAKGKMEENLFICSSFSTLLTLKLCLGHSLESETSSFLA